MSIGTSFGHDLTGEDMDRLLAERCGEVDARLQEAYDAKARGAFASLEPPHVFLAEERQIFKTSQG